MNVCIYKSSGHVKRIFIDILRANAEDVRRETHYLGAQLSTRLLQLRAALWNDDLHRHHGAGFSRLSTYNIHTYIYSLVYVAAILIIYVLYCICVCSVLEGMDYQHLAHCLHSCRRRVTR